MRFSVAFHWFLHEMQRWDKMGSDNVPWNYTDWFIGFIQTLQIHPQYKEKDFFGTGWNALTYFMALVSEYTLKRQKIFGFLMFLGDI